MSEVREAAPKKATNSAEHWQKFLVTEILDADFVCGFSSHTPIAPQFHKILVSVWEQEYHDASVAFVRCPSATEWNRLADAMKAWQHVRLNLRTIPPESRI